MANHVAQLDTNIKIVTPENIAFEYRVAGPFRRLPAYLIDLAIRVFVVILMLVILSVIFGAAGLGSVGVGFGLILWFAMSWFYGGICETVFNGQTPGKRALGIRVLTSDGQPITGTQAVLRNILRFIDMQPMIYPAWMEWPPWLALPLYLVGLIAASCNDRFQRLGDLACGTMVVIEERPWLHGVSRTGEPEAIRIAGLIPANYRASRTLAKALAAYVQRRRNFSFGRRMEIARPLAEPLRIEFGLPPNTNLDILLCGLYERTFITDRQEEPPSSAGSPFGEVTQIPSAISPNNLQPPQPPPSPPSGSPPSPPPATAFADEKSAVAAAMAERDEGAES